MSDDRGECVECGCFFGSGEWADVWCRSCEKMHISCPHCHVPLEFPVVAAVLEKAREEHDAEKENT